MGIREEFPIFQHLPRPFIYMDNAATSQKPAAVLQRMNDFYLYENANIHRGSYPLSRKAENVYDDARDCLREWIDAALPEEIVFTKGSTEAVNLAASALFEGCISSRDNVVVTELEHSSNYFPWEHQCRRFGCEFRTAAAEKDGSISTEQILKCTDGRTRLISVTGMSNATGFMPDLKGLIREAHRRGILVFVDATQLVVHRKISVRDLDCDLLCFSGHKLYGPMGTGILYGKRALLEEMAPFLYGGDMVEQGDGNCIVFRKDPGKYEAGTQNIAGAAGLAAAVRFLGENSFETELLPYEAALSERLSGRLSGIPGLKRHGCPDPSSPIYNFTMDGIGAYDIGIFLASSGIAVRSGAHCAYPLMRRMGLDASVRISLSFYNTEEEIDLLAERLKFLSGKVRR